MARLFQRTNAQKLLDQESSTTGANSASNSARLDALEEDVEDIDDRLTLAELAVVDHETRITDLETP